MIVRVGIIGEVLEAAVAIDRWNGAADWAVRRGVFRDDVLVAAHVGDGDGIRRAGQARRNVGARLAQMGRVRSDVTHFQDPLFPEFTLNGEIPLLRAGCNEMARNGQHKQIRRGNRTWAAGGALELGGTCSGTPTESGERSLTGQEV